MTHWRTHKVVVIVLLGLLLCLSVYAQDKIEGFDKLSAAEKAEVRKMHADMKAKQDADFEKEKAAAQASGAKVDGAAVVLSKEDQAHLDSVQTGSSSGPAGSTSGTGASALLTSAQQLADAKDCVTPVAAPTSKNSDLAARRKKMYALQQERIKSKAEEMKEKLKAFSDKLLKKLKWVAEQLMPLLPQEWQIAELPSTMDELKEVLIKLGRMVLLKCHEGSIDALKVIQPVCTLLVKGIKIGDGYLGILSLNYDKAAGKITGAADLSCIFGPAASQFDFQVFTAKGSAGIAFQVPAPGAFLDLPKLLSLMPGSGGGSSQLSFLEMGTADALKSAISKLGLDNSRVFIESLGFNAQPFGLRFKGTLEFLGNMSLSVTVASTLKGKTAFALAVGWENGGLDKFMRKLLGPTYSYLAFFTGKTLKVSFSTHDVDLTPYPALTDNGQFTSISQGVTFELVGYYDAQSPNDFQRFMAKMFQGDFFIRIKVTPEEFSIALGLGAIVFSPKTKLVDNFLSLTVGLASNPKVVLSISGNLETTINDSPVVFKGKLSFDLIALSLELEVVMKGYIPFRSNGVEFAIGEIYGMVAITFKPPFFAGFGVGLAFRIGPENDPVPPIKGAGYVFVSIVKPQDSWFYFKLEDLTFEAIYKHIFLKPVPHWVKQVGFRASLSLSISAQDRIAPNGDALPAGIAFKGKLELFGWWIKAELVINLKNFLVRVECGPLSLGGFQLQRSPTDAVNGPLFHFEGTMQPFVLKLEVEAFVNAWIISVYVKINLDKDALRLRVIAKIFFVFVADIAVDVEYGASGKSVTLSISFYTESVSEESLSMLTRFADECSAKADRAWREFEAAKQMPQRNFERCTYNCNTPNCNHIFILMSAHLGVVTEARAAELIHALDERDARDPTKSTDPAVLLTVEEVMITKTRWIVEETAQKSFEQLEQEGLLLPMNTRHDYTSLQMELQAWADDFTDVNDGTNPHHHHHHSFAETFAQQEDPKLQAQRHQMHHDPTVDSYWGNPEQQHHFANGSHSHYPVATRPTHGIHRHNHTTMVELFGQTAADAMWLHPCDWQVWLWCWRARAECRWRLPGCHIGCGFQFIADGFYVLGKGIEFVFWKAVSEITGAIVKIIRWIQSNFKLFLNIKAQISTQTFMFAVHFHLKIWAIDIKFDLVIDFSKMSVKGMATITNTAQKDHVKKTCPTCASEIR